MIRTILKFAGFTLVCLGFTGWLAVTIGNITLFEDTYTLSATFDDVTGLLPNDNVKIAGVVVGKVTGVTVEKGRAKVTFKVRDNVRIPSDSKAGIRWRNLLGQRYVYLYPGEASTSYTDGDRIDETQSVVDLGELFNRLGPIIAAIDPKQVNTFLDAIVEGLDGNQQSVQQVLGDLATLMKGLATRDDAIGDLIEDLDTVAGTVTRRDEQIRLVLDNLTELAGTFSSNTDIVDAAVTDLGEVSANLDTLLSSRRSELDGTLASLLSVLETVEGKLGKLDSALGALDEASVKIFSAGRFGEFLNQVILCAGTTPYDGESVPPCPGAANGLGTVAGAQGAGADSSSGGAGGGGTGPGTTVPAPSTGVDAVEDLVGSLVGGG